MIDCSSEEVHLTVDLLEHLVEVPLRVARFHSRDPALPVLSREHRPEAMRPESDRLVADVDSELMQQVLEFRSDSGIRTYISTATRMSSRLLMKHMNRLGLIMGKRLAAARPDAGQFP